MDQILCPARRMAPSGGASLWKISTGNYNHNLGTVPPPKNQNVL